MINAHAAGFEFHFAVDYTIAKSATKEGTDRMKNFLNGFKQFALKGNVLDLAVGVMIGGAFNKIVTSLVNDMFMPLLSLIIGQVNLSGAFLALDGQHYVSVDAATQAGVSVFNYGAFLNTIIDFLFMAFVIYLLVRVITRFMPKPAPEAPALQARLCPYCKREIHDEATRCPHCTTPLEGFHPVSE